MSLLLFTKVYHNRGCAPLRSPAAFAAAGLRPKAAQRGGRPRAGGAAGTRWIFRSGVNWGAQGVPATNPPTPPPYPNQLPDRPTSGRPPPSPTARRPPYPNQLPTAADTPFPNHLPTARPLNASALSSAPRSRRPPHARPSAKRVGGLVCVWGGRRAARGGGGRIEGAGGRQMEGESAAVGNWGAAVERLGWAARSGAVGQLEGGGVGGLVARHARSQHPAPPN